MTLPNIISDLLALLFDLAVPAATCTLVLAGLALRSESGVNFEAGGRFQRWMVWTVILLTLPQLLAWFAAQGIQLPPQQGAASSPWLSAMEASFNPATLLTMNRAGGLLHRPVAKPAHTGLARQCLSG